MLDQGLFKKHFVGQEGFQWWVGQIADEEVWKSNIPSMPQASNDGIQGFGERYKVRIMGYHTADPNSLPDEDLPWASVLYPVTAGSGGRGSSQSANLTQGTFVIGFWLDGDDAQVPVIMGCLGYNEDQAILRLEGAKFVPFSGYTESYDQGKVATTSVRETPDEGTITRQTSTDPAAPGAPTAPPLPPPPPASSSGFSQSTLDKYPDTPAGIQAAYGSLRTDKTSNSVPGLTNHLNSKGLTGDARVLETARIMDNGGTIPSSAPTTATDPNSLTGNKAEDYASASNASANAFDPTQSSDITKGYWTEPVINPDWKESSTAPSVAPMTDFTKTDSDDPKSSTPNTSDCSPTPVSALQQDIANVIQEVEKVRKAATDFRYTVTRGAEDIQSKINALVEKATKYVSGSMKFVYAEMEKGIQNSLQASLKSTYFNLFPPEQAELKETVEQIADEVACMFRSLAQNLFGMVYDFLSSTVMNMVNIPMCFVQNFVGSVLGSVLGTITGVINGLVAGVSAVVGGVIDVVTTITDAVAEVLSFLQCNTSPECSDIGDWSILQGPGRLAADILSGGDSPGSLFSNANQVASDLAAAADQVVGGVTQVVDTAVSAVQDVGSIVPDFGGIFNNSACGGGFNPDDPCGSPLLNIMGGGTGVLGAQGNVIVSSIDAGGILGVDMINFGHTNYDGSISMNVVDNCGNGGGSQLQPILGPVGTFMNTGSAVSAGVVGAGAGAAGVGAGATVGSSVNQSPVSNSNVWTPVSPIIGNPNSFVGNIQSGSPNITFGNIGGQSLGGAPGVLGLVVGSVISMNPNTSGSVTLPAGTGGGMAGSTRQAANVATVTSITTGGSTTTTPTTTTPTTTTATIGSLFGGTGSATGATFGVGYVPPGQTPASTFTANINATSTTITNISNMSGLSKGTAITLIGGGNQVAKGQRITVTIQSITAGSGSSGSTATVGATATVSQWWVAGFTGGSVKGATLSVGHTPYPQTPTSTFTADIDSNTNIITNISNSSGLSNGTIITLMDGSTQRSSVTIQSITTGGTTSSTGSGSTGGSTTGGGGGSPVTTVTINRPFGGSGNMTNVQFNHNTPNPNQANAWNNNTPYAPGSVVQQPIPPSPTTATTPTTTTPTTTTATLTSAFGGTGSAIRATFAVGHVPHGQTPGATFTANINATSNTITNISNSSGLSKGTAITLIGGGNQVGLGQRITATIKSITIVTTPSTGPTTATVSSWSVAGFTGGSVKGATLSIGGPTGPTFTADIDSNTNIITNISNSIGFSKGTIITFQQSSVTIVSIP